MKRIGNIYKNICSIDNLILADNIARKGKRDTASVRQHDMRRGCNLIAIHNALCSQTYSTSPYTVFKIKDPKEREIFRLPYYPDRIVHHAIMNELERIFVARFTADTYSCIKGKGIHGAHGAIKTALIDRRHTRYCLKMDVKKFYPSVDHEVLLSLLRRIIKDKQLLWLLGEIIDSAPGLPIGNYLSQYLANFYLSYFDHWIKEVKGVKYYFRYADDIVILSADKSYLHQLRTEITTYLAANLKLTVKDNYQVFPVEKRGIDFVGYKFFHTHILIRKSIKQSFARMLAKHPNVQSINSYKGWSKHANTFNLLTKFHDQIQRTKHTHEPAELYRNKGERAGYSERRNSSSRL